ncbi:glycosyltransferase family 4 protein [Desulfofarcimen acetoxidans]|jgi:glycosyltransferase involved in cell wall biosynthesis|nr:glycosyltransferase family 4 protein [Desulfofarcimen acetoxidans]
MRVLFLPNTPSNGPSARYRVYQFVPYLAHNNIKAVCHSALTPFIYSKFSPAGGWLHKIIYFTLSALFRILALLRLPFYDVIFIQKLVLPHVYPFPEVLLCKLGKWLGKRVIFDFDDAIYTVSAVRKKTLIERLSYPERVQRIIGLCDDVVVGNEYLAHFARKYHKNVHLIPTSIDMTKYPVPKFNEQKAGPFVIGWIGTPSTLPYLYSIKPALQEIALKHEVVLRIVGGKDYACSGIEVEYLTWSLDNEVEYICSFDIGIMPLTDDPWSRGKCGLKLLQYLAAGVPAVASPVGVNKDIIDDGVNGYWAESTRQWVDKIERIISFPAEHINMTRLARKTVEDEYSLAANLNKLIKVLSG